MTHSNDRRHRAILQNIARRAMLEHGMQPDFSLAALAELDGIRGPAENDGTSARDLRDLLWCSIDNDDSLDLDQLSVAESMNGGDTRVLIAIADVDAIVRRDSEIDKHARQNTTSIYTDAVIFPMLPEKLSNNFTSLNPDGDRLAVVIEMVFDKAGAMKHSDIYRAGVRNKAKLAYNAVAAWLDGDGSMPEAMAAAPGLAENIRLQDRMAQALKEARHHQGALDLQTIEAKAIFQEDMLSDLAAEERNCAKEIIEEFMIAANGVTARYLENQGYPSVRRIVRTPKRWNRIVELAAEQGTRLPEHPDVKALERFLLKEWAADPLRFPDLSLSVIKLLGNGEYAVAHPGKPVSGHFGLAVRDYAHSTAPNRRFPDVITQRLLKAALAGQPVPYDDAELAELAQHCTEKEDEAKKIERQVGKSAAAMLLEHRIGEQFDSIVTGASNKGTWVRLLHPPIEGRLEHGYEGLDVGHRVRVQLVHTDVERGFIDFKRIR